MSSTAAIDFDTIEAQVRADAERKVTVLREIVDTHTDLTREREEFLSADADRVRRLTALLAEASAAGFDRKTLAPFHAEPLGTKRPATRKRTTTTSRTPATATPARADTSPDTTAAPTPATDPSAGGLKAMLFTVLCAAGVIVGAFIAGLALAVAPEPDRSRTQASRDGDGTAWPAVVGGAVAVVVGLAGLLTQLIAGWG